MKCSICNKEATHIIQITTDGWGLGGKAFAGRCNKHLEDFQITGRKSIFIRYKNSLR